MIEHFKNISRDTFYNNKIIPVIEIEDACDEINICRSIAADLLMTYYCIPMTDMTSTMDVSNHVTPILHYAMEYPSQHMLVHIYDFRKCTAAAQNAILCMIFRAYNNIPENVHFIITDPGDNMVHILTDSERRRIVTESYKMDNNAFTQSNNLHPAIRTAIKNFSGNIFHNAPAEKEMTEKLTPICCPQSLLRLNKILNDTCVVTKSRLNENTYRDLITAFIGWSPFSALILFELTQTA